MELTSGYLAATTIILICALALTGYTVLQMVLMFRAVLEANRERERELQGRLAAANSTALTMKLAAETQDERVELAAVSKIMNQVPAAVAQMQQAERDAPKPVQETGPQFRGVSGRASLG